MAYFPIFTDISEKKCIIVGGGKVALRKVETLLKYGAHIMVIAEEICPEIQELIPQEDLRWRKAVRGDFHDAVLAVAATSSRQANHMIHLWCKDLNIPVNVVDAPQECSFLFPAVVKRGNISIGINTGGESPIVSSQIRRKIEEAVPVYYADIARQMGQIKDWLKENVSGQEERRRILKQVAAEAFAKEGPLNQAEIDLILKG